MNNLEKAQMQQKRGLRLVFFPCPFQGHINPMFQLATLLHSRGFSITIVHTRFNSPNYTNYPHFTFVSIPDGISESQASIANALALVTLLNVNCIEPFRDCLARLLSDDSQGEPIPCIISDFIMHFTQGVAESFKLPRIVLRTSSVTSFNAFIAYPVLREKGYLPIQDSQLESPVPELPPLRVKDLPVIKTDEPENLYQLISSSVNETKASSGLIWNTFEHLDGQALAIFRQELLLPCFSIGPFHKWSPASSCSSLLEQDHSCIAWLDAQAPKSVLYVSIGSIAAMDNSEFVEIAWGLANCKLPFLWVVRPGSVHGSNWKETLPDGFLEMTSGRSCVVKWAPQEEVLAHPAVGGFWTHNGWNSTMESICEGVPMICWPSFGDQMVNARYVSHVWKIGVQLENGLERGEIESAIKRLMLGKEGEEMRERIMTLKEEADLCLKKGGSSYESLDSLIACIMSF